MKVGEIVGSLIPGVGSYLGARENAKATKAANKVNAAMARENLDFQKTMARSGIQMKVEDAQRAGISPLAALGAQTFNPSPVSAGAVPHLDTSLADMGQSVGRAVSAVASHGERQQATLQLNQMNALQMENQALQNDFLRVQIRNAANPGVPAAPRLGPALSNSDMPLLTGQGDSRPTSRSPYVVEKPLERIHSSPGNPAQEVGAVPDYGFARTTTGLAVVPSKDVKEKIEDQMIPELMWAGRNLLAPNIGAGPKAPDPKIYPPPRGSSHWVWNPLYQEFQGNRDIPSWLNTIKGGLKTLGNPSNWKGR